MDRLEALEREVAFLRELVKSQNAMLERLLAERAQPQMPLVIPYPVPAPCPCPIPNPYPPILPGPTWPAPPIFPAYPEIICGGEQRPGSDLLFTSHASMQ